MELTDKANWDGLVPLTSTNVGANEHRGNVFRVKKYYYCNEFEAALAVFLHRNKVEFTPDVQMHYERPNGRRGTFVPDFVFNTWPFIWTRPGTNKQILIHGIEVKKRPKGKFPDRAIEKIECLYKQRGIRILLLSNASAMKMCTDGFLPMVPFNSTTQP